MPTPTGLAVSTPSVTGAPTAREEFACCLHPNGLIYYYGGSNNSSGSQNDTWSYNPLTNTHTQITTVHHPNAQIAMQMAYDPVSGKIVLFGGENASLTFLAETWTIDPTVGTPDWSQLTPGTSPALRSGHVMFNDPVTGQVMVYGGNNSNITFYDDLFTWTGTTWSSVNAALTGTGRTEPGCSTMGNKTVIFGGWTGSVNRSDTWSWNGSTASLVPTTHSPSGRVAAGGFTYVPTTGYAVLTGGLDESNGNDHNDMWLFNGFDWTLVTPTGSNLEFMSLQQLVWHPPTQQLVQLFGEQGATAGAGANPRIATVYYIQPGPTITNCQLATAAATNQATITLTPKAIGNLLLLHFDIEAFSTTTTISSIADTGITPTTGAGKWTLIKRQAATSTYGPVEVWSATVTAVASATVTLTLSTASGQQNDIAVTEYTSGLGPSTVWTAISNGSAFTTTNVTTVTPASLTSTAANQLYESYAACIGTPSVGTTAGFGYAITPQNNIFASNTTAPNSTAEQPTNPMTSGTFDSVSAIIAAASPVVPPSAHGMSIAVSRAANF